VGVLALAVLHDTPDERVVTPQHTSWGRVRAEVVSAWRHPGTRLGMWTHFSTQFSARCSH